MFRSTPKTAGARTSSRKTMSRSAALLLVLLLVTPSLSVLGTNVGAASDAPAVSVPAGSVASVDIVTDAAGDTANGGAAASDLLRIGGASTPSVLSFFLKVNTGAVPSPAQHPAVISYDLNFTIGAASYYIDTQYGTAPAGGFSYGTSTGTGGGAIFWHDVNGQGALGKGVAVGWDSDAIRFDILRADLDVPPIDGTTITNIHAQASLNTRNGARFDETAAGTYVVGNNAPAAPGAPTGLVATGAASGGSVALAWRAPASAGTAPVTGYKVYRGSASGAETLLSTTGNALTFTDAAATVGSTAYYQVSAVSTAGEGPRSAESAATPGVPPAAPDAPTGIAAGASKGQVVVTWDAPLLDHGARVASYQVLRGTSSGGEVLVGTVSAATPSFVDAPLTNGQTYFYQVAATNAQGTGPRSAEASATPIGGTTSASFTTHPGPYPDANGAGEPTLGADWKTGNFLINRFTSQFRVSFDDTAAPPTATWTDVTSPFSKANIDPILSTDPVTGRTFAGGDDGLCDGLSFTDDDGASWLHAGNACTYYAEDHPMIGQGPPVAGLPGPNPAVYPDVVYMCQDQAPGLGFAGCAVSWDGGLTFQHSAPVQCPTLVNPGAMGHMAVGPDGWAYIPVNGCPSNAAQMQGVSISSNNGITFSGVSIPGIRYNADANLNDPAVAVGRGDKVAGGRIYFGATQGSLGANAKHPVVSVSTNHGTTWSTPIDLAVVSSASAGDAVGVQSIALPTMTAGDDDRAAFAFLGTKSAGNAFTNTFSGSWDLYVALTYDGGAHWRTYDATPTDPVQKGCIWLQGGSNACRNLLDFMDVVADKQGRVVVGYPDGCVAACPGVGASTHSLATITRQSTGLGLFAAYDNLALPLTALPGGAYAGQAGQAIPIAGYATGGTPGYATTWSVVGKPAGSNGGSLAAPNAGATTFTPDIIGTYTLQLHATDGAGSAADGTTTLTATAGVPSMPTTLAATGGDGHVVLTWGLPASNGGAAVTGYKVYRGTVSGNTALLTAGGCGAVGNVLTCTDATVTNGVTYFYRISAVNSVGEGSLSAEASASPNGVSSPPSAPQGLQAKAGDARVTLVWNAPLSQGSSPISAYQVYRGTTSGGATLLGAGTCSGLGNVLTCVDGTVTNGLTYYYQVSAVNGIGEGPRSAEASARPSAGTAVRFQEYNVLPTTLGDGAGEPGVGVNWKTGAVFINSFPALGLNPNAKNVKVIKAVFDDTKVPPTVAFTEVTSIPPASYVNVDPLLFTDSVAGRTWAGGLAGPCSFIAYSDDDGQTWSRSADPCAPPSTDHETLGSGPWASPEPPGATWPGLGQHRAVYYCLQPGLTTGPATCARSLDGGVTFAETAPPWGRLENCHGLHGHIRVADDGAAYLPNKGCDGRAAIAVTLDNGVTWSLHGLPGTKGDGRFDPSVAPTRGNWAYFGATESDGAYIGLTKDHGASWQDVGQGNGAPAGTKAFRVSDLTSPRVQRAEFAEVIAGDDERAAFAFLGSTSSSPNQDDCSLYANHVWYMYVAFTYDAGKTWEVTKASNDPVQLGPIGDTGSCRDLLDFNDITVAKDGKVIVGYGDGCVAAVNSCVVGGPVARSQRGEGSSIATIARQYAGRGLFAAYDVDSGATPLVALPAGPYASQVSVPVQLRGNANGGAGPYTFTWSVATKPAGSTAGTSSFSNPNARNPTFTPDVAGGYTLRLAVQDSAFGSTTGDASLTAFAQSPTCGTTGVIVGVDDPFDGGLAGTAAELTCLRAADDAGTFHLYIDRLGSATNSRISAGHPLSFDVYLTASYAADTQFILEVNQDSTGALTANYVDPSTFLLIPTTVKPVTVTLEGNTLHLATPRGEILSQGKNGLSLEDVHVVANHCEGVQATNPNQCITSFYEDDVAPNLHGAYVLGSSSLSRGGQPIAACSVTVATDSTTDTTAAGAGKGRRELLSVDASDTPSTFSVCLDVADFSDAPPAASDGTQLTQYNVFWTAEYQNDGVTDGAIAYALQASFNRDGSVASAALLKGVNVSNDAASAYQTVGGAAAGPATAKVVGNTVVITAQKSDIGGPRDGQTASGFVGNVKDQASTATTFDRAPSTGRGGTAFTFGNTTSDSAPPSQVTGLSVADPRTGSTLNLAWNAAADDVGVVKYNVKRSTASGGSYAIVGTPAGTSFTDAGLTTGTTYYYVVSAVDAAGNQGADSAQASGAPSAPADTTPPTVPSNLVATSVSSNAASIGWSPSTDPESGVKQYKVFRDGAQVGTSATNGFSDTGLSPDTTYSYTISAVNNVDLESARSAALSVHTSSLPSFVTITDPAVGAQVAPPTTFRGTFSTNGQAPQSGGSLSAALPAAVAAWAQDPYVNTVLHSPEWPSVLDELSAVDGFVTAYPSPDDVVVVELSGAVPGDAPTATTGGLALRYETNVQPQPILTPAASEPQHVYTLAEVERMVADGSVLAGAPSSPTPGVEQGLGPGTGIQMALYDTTAPAGVKTFICTASFLFEDAATGKYYLATAGHCLLDTGATDGTAATKARWVRLCFRNCVNNGGVTTLGDYVLLEPDSAYAGYHPVAWAHQNGVGDDAGLIEIPASLQPLLRPWLWFWGGPTGVQDLATNDVLVHWGHGATTGTTFATQGRAALVVASTPLGSANQARAFTALGAIYGGDSGSDASKAAPRTDKVAVGDKASGILTHSVAIAGQGLVAQMFGTQMTRALDMWQNGTPGNPGLGFRPRLVTEDATIRVAGAPPSSTLGAAITAPSNGASIDPAATPTVSVQGTATFPPGSAPGTGSVTYYLHRNSPGGCAATLERLWMDPTPSAVRESGSGCGSVRDPAGPVVETAVNITAQVFPTAPPSRTASSIVLDPTRNVTAVVYLNASLNRTTNANAPPGYVVVPGASVVNDLEVYVTYEVGGYTKEVGRQRLFPGPLLLDAPTPVTFSFLPQVSQIPANADIRLTFVVHESVTHVSTFYGGSTLSRLTLPLGSLPSAAVQVSVDDPAFGASNLLPVTGTTSWTAPWNAGGAASGSHTLYARAVQGTSTSSAASIAVALAQSAGPTASFTSSAAGLTASFTDTSTAGSSALAGWSWTFGDGGTSALRNPGHTYAAAGTYTVTLQVTDTASRTSNASAQVTVTSTPQWQVQTRLTGPNGQVFDWTTVAQPADGSNGFWSQMWSPSPAAAPGTYTLTARLLKDGAQSSTDSHTFQVLDTNRPPIVDAGADQAVDEGTHVALHGSASDPDGDAFTTSWTQTGGPDVALSGAGTLTPSFTVPDQDADTVYTFRLTATDSAGGSASALTHVSARDFSRIAIDQVNGSPAPPAAPLTGTANIAGSSSLAGHATSTNQAPTAAITDVVVDGLSLSASGASSFDPDGAIVSYAWNLGNGATRSGASLSYAYPVAGTYTLTLTVTDDLGAVGQSSFGPFAVQKTRAGLVVDAGDSSAVRIGDLATLRGQAFGSTGNVAFTWDTDGNGVGDRAGQSIQVSTAGMSPGPRAFQVFGTDAGSGKTGTDNVTIYLYDVVPHTDTFTQFVPVGLPDEQAGAGGADQATFQHQVNVPPGTQLLDATLTWGFYRQVLPDGNPSGIEGGPNDFDLYAFSPGGAQDTSSAAFKRPEHISVPGPTAGLWTFEVRSFIAVAETYTLYVNTTQAPPSPVPSADQVSEVCFSTPDQTLVAKASTKAGLTVAGAWDTDLDGAYDDGSGLSVTTHFTVGSGAHLVGFRATSSAGYRTSILVAVKVLSTCPTIPSVVVVGVADTGINPYADQFAGELLPYPELRDFTTADASNPTSKDVLARHKVTNTLLPFTKHPSEYIPGFPADALPLTLTMGGGYYKSLDDGAVWSKGHAAIPLNQWFWIPGTKIVGAIDVDDSGAVLAAADSTPLYDDDGHGTASASVAVGNTVGNCPRCVLAFAEGLSGDTTLLHQPWIDLVSFSFGALGNVGTPDAGTTDATAASKDAAERGMTISYAAGNGNDDAFITPEQTYTSSTTGPDWHIRVGAVQQGTNSVVLGTGKPVLWSSYGAGSIPASCRSSYGANCNHSGTSAATPLSTGVLGSALLTARIALGDTNAGPKAPADADGQLQAVAVGTPLAASPWLKDGVLQRAELWNATFHCASDFGTSLGFPGDGPKSALDYLYGGYGLADKAALACASQALLGLGPTKAKPDMDAFVDVDQAIRVALWGDWDGDGDGNDGGNFNHATNPSMPLAAELTAADVGTLDAASATVRDLMGQLGQAQSAPPVTETYYLHQDTCGGSADTPYMSRAPAAGAEGGNFCVNLLATNMDTTWLSRDATGASFAKGSTIAVDLRAAVQQPRPGFTIRATLLVDGVAVGQGEATVSDPIGSFIGCTDWFITMSTSADIPAGATLGLRAQSDLGTQDVATCYEGGAGASRLSVTGVGTGGGNSGGTPTATITSPVNGAVVDPAAGPVSITGTATFPGQATAQKLFLRRDQCSNLNTDTLYLSPVDAADAGNGCALGAGAAAPVLDFVERYPLVASQLPVTLQQGGSVDGTITFDCDGPDPGEVQLVLASDHGEVGQQTVDFVCVDAYVNGQRVASGSDAAFSFGVANAAAGTALGSLTFEVHIRQQGGIHWTELDHPASFITIPRVGAASTKAVQVSVDDPTFGAGSQLAVSGTDAWSASWDTAGVAAGAHTLYARAGTGSGFGPAASVGVTIQAGQQARVGAVQVQVVPAGGVPSATGWSPASSYVRSSGAWTFAWDTDAVPNGRYDVHARLLGDGAEEARTVMTMQVGNMRAPTLDPIGDPTVDENQPLSFTVRATDPDGDAITYTASNLPPGATFSTGTQVFDWTPSFTQAGTYPAVCFRATDSTGLFAERCITITVNNVNRAPVLDPIGDRTVGQNHTLAFTVTAQDADTDPLTFSASGLPAGATFSAGGAFSWKPGIGQAGQHNVTFSVSDGQGGSDTQTIAITVTSLPPAACATIAPTTTDRLSPVQFSDCSTDTDGAVQAWAWAFGDGATSAQQSPAHTYGTLGTFTVTLTVTDDSGQANATTAGTVTVLNLAPTASGSSNRTFTDRITPVRFTDASSDRDGTISSWLWAFGDGATSTQQSPTYTYPTLGRFTPKLTVTDNDGATANVTLAQISVANIAAAAKGKSNTTDTDRLTAVQFTDQSTDKDGTVVSWRWDFGDGTNSTLQNPTHTYSALGTFTPKLTAIDNDGTGTTVSLPAITVRNLLPTAMGSSDRTTTDRLTAVRFTDASSDRDGTIASWAWNFGDSTTSTAQDPSHTYSALGTFTPTLRVTDNDGGASTLLSLPPITVSNIAPSAAGASNTTQTDRLTAVRFTDASSDADGTIASWAWDFGDSTTSTAQNPSHTYSALGTFTPTLRVTDNDGTTSTVSLAAITVSNLVPTSAGNASRTTTDRLTPVDFTDQSTDRDGNVTAWRWDFGDGTNSTARNPSHTYASLGQKTVTLTATDNDGASSVATIARIQVRNIAPHAQFAGPPGDVNRVDPVQFMDQSTDPDGRVVGWLWDFGDGHNSTDRNATHVFAALGQFTVKLTSTDDDGDSNTTSLLVRVVNLAPTAGFTYTPAHPQALLPTTFNGTGVDRDGSIATWAWDFGDGEHSTLQNPVKVYTAGGLYNVTLRITDNDGGVGIATQTVFVCSSGVDASLLLNLDHLHVDVKACLDLVLGDLPAPLGQGALPSPPGAPVPDPTTGTP